MTPDELAAALEGKPAKPVLCRLYLGDGRVAYFEIVNIVVENGEPFIEMEEV